MVNTASIIQIYTGKYEILFYENFKNNTDKHASAATAPSQESPVHTSAMMSTLTM
jgi:hypothetical protein